MPDNGLINFDAVIDLRARNWASDGTLDNPILVDATGAPGFGGFSLWDIDAGEGSLVNAGGGDFELSLDSGGSAVHGAGVLNAPDDDLYVFSFDTGTDNADVTVDLLIDGVLVSSQTAEYAPGTPDRGGVIFDLSTLNLAAFTIGSSSVSIRVTNNEGGDLSLDNFELLGGDFPQIEQFGSTIFDGFGLSGAITAEIDDIFFTNATGAEAAAAEAAIDFDIIEIGAGSFSWSFKADKDAFDFLSSGEQTAVQIFLTLSGADGGSTEVPVLIGITGDNQAPTANDQSVTVAEDGSVSGTLTADDIDGDNLTFQVVDRPQNGDVVINANGSFTYTPDADSTAADSFTFKATDPFGGSSIGTVNVNVTGRERRAGE